jgi:hypothetical protein
VVATSHWALYFVFITISLVGIHPYIDILLAWGWPKDLNTKQPFGATGNQGG